MIHQNNKTTQKPSSLKDAGLEDDPEMPDIAVPSPFLQQIVKNRAEVEEFEKKVKKMQEDL